MNEETIMTMISYAGAGRCKLVEAMREAAKGNYEKAYELIELSDSDITTCHKAQTEALFSICNENDVNPKISVLLIHAMDQVMDTMNMRDMVIEMINLVKGRIDDD